MSSLRDEIRALSFATRAWLVAVLIAFNAFALARMAPINCSLPSNEAQGRGDYDRNVYRVQMVGELRAERPFFEVRDHLVYLSHNPAIFVFVAELFARAGVTSPIPNQLLTIALWNIGIVLALLWLRRLLESELAACASLGFLLTTPFLLFASASIHHEPYCFVFFNAALYAYARHLDPEEQKPRAWLVATFVAYFLLCTSYWFYYVSAFLMLVALQVKAGGYRGVRIKQLVVLGSATLLVVGITLAQVAWVRGGLDKAAFHMTDVAVARATDQRIEGSEWYPKKRFVKKKDFANYPSIVAKRMQTMSGVHPGWLALVLGAALLLAGKEGLRRYRYLPLVLIAGFSWNVLMIQHSVMHNFSGQYGWFMWVLIVGSFAAELQRVLAGRPARARQLALAAALPVFALGMSQIYAPNLAQYLSNLATGEAVDPYPAPKKKKKKGGAKKKSKKKKKSSASAPAPSAAETAPDEPPDDLPEEAPEDAPESAR